MKLAIMIVIVILLLLLLECVRELKTFRSVHYKVVSGKLKNLAKEKKILLLSDLHNRVYGKNNVTLLAAIKREHPDVILITGDMLIGKVGEPCETAQKLISKLPAIAPVYYANGNHEQRMKEHPDKYGTVYASYKTALQEKGVRFLENESAEIFLDSQPINITGLEIPSEYYEKFRKKSFEKRDVSACVGKPSADCYQILLAHHPGYFKAYKAWGADLVVSGHLHGGVARIPGWRGVITPQAILFPKYSGEMTKEGDSSIVVSKGLGTHTVNIRLFNPAELVVIHLQRESI